MHKMKTEFVLEIKRQVVHLLLGGGVSAMLWFFGKLAAIPLIAATVAFLIMPKIAPGLGLSNHLLFHFERREDIDSFPFRGSVWYCFGAMFPVMLLPKEVGCISLLVLGVGDSMSTLFGKFYGRRRLGSKSLEGTGAFIISAMLFCLIFIALIGYQKDLLLTSVIFTVVGAAIELFGFMNDNFSIPVGLTALYLIAF